MAYGWDFLWCVFSVHRAQPVVICCQELLANKLCYVRYQLKRVKQLEELVRHIVSSIFISLHAGTGLGNHIWA